MELIDTNDKNLAYLKTHVKESDRLFLCKDMDALYQDYVNNLMTVEEFADMVGTRYSYILGNVSMPSYEQSDMENGMER